jgi:bacterial/archaeal transporter family-2 protein
MERVWALAATLAAGALVAFQPPANALLARIVGDLGAAFTSLLISTLIVGALLVLVGDPGELRHIGGFKPEHLLGGVAGAAIVLVSLITVRHLGAGGVAAAMVALQLIGSVVIDRLGILGVEQTMFSAERVIGVVLLIAGTLLVTAR